MLVTGTVPLVLMMIQYCRTLKRLRRKANVISNPAFQMAFAVLLLGASLLSAIVATILLE